MIEKHFKYNNYDKTADSSFSLTPKKLRDLKDLTLKIYQSKKKVSKNSEKISANLRRSIFAKNILKKNQTLTKDNIETLRPAIGISASKYFDIIGRKIRKNIKKGDPIFYKDLI